MMENLIVHSVDELEAYLYTMKEISNCKERKIGAMEGVTSSQECLQQLSRTGADLSDKTDDTFSISQSIDSCVNDSTRYTLTGDEKETTETSDSPFLQDNSGFFSESRPRVHSEQEQVDGGEDDGEGHGEVESLQSIMCDKSDSPSSVCEPSQSTDDFKGQESSSSKGEVMCSDSGIREPAEVLCPENAYPPTDSGLSEEISGKDETTPSTELISDENINKSDAEENNKNDSVCETTAKTQSEESNEVENPIDEPVSYDKSLELSKSDQDESLGEVSTCDKYQEGKEGESVDDVGEMVAGEGEETGDGKPDNDDLTEFETDKGNQDPAKSVCSEKVDEEEPLKLNPLEKLQSELEESECQSDSLPVDDENKKTSSNEKDDVFQEDISLEGDNMPSASEETSLEGQNRKEISEKEDDVIPSQEKATPLQDGNASLVDDNTDKNTSFTQVNVEKDTTHEKDNVEAIESQDPIGGDKTQEKCNVGAIESENPIAADTIQEKDNTKAIESGDPAGGTTQEKDDDKAIDTNPIEGTLPISAASQETEQTIDNEQEQGADEEICIIPDTERIISQAEKDAASALPTLRDLSEASASVQTDISSSTTDTSDKSSEKYVVSKFDKDGTFTCEQCLLDRKVMFRITKGDVIKYICNDSCMKEFKLKHPDGVVSANEGEIRVKNLSACTDTPSVSFIRKCAACGNKTDKPDSNLAWEIMDFCNEFCLSKYQREIGSKCSSCNTDVRANSLGKYCVRFGNDIRQFCSSDCLEEYKKGLKVCSYCQQDISKGSEGFLAPVGDKGHFKDFCSQQCMEKYDVMTNDRVPKVDPGTKCCVCQKTDITIEFEWNGRNNYFCSEPCFVAFSFVNQITAGKCAMCRRNFPRQTLEKHTMYYDNIQQSFCSGSCQNIYIIAHRKIVPCNWCKVKKYNFDMIRRYSTNNQVLNMCSVNCYSLYLVSVNAVQAKKIQCDFCLKTVQSMYHLTMSDATIRNFCTYSCVMSFQRQFPKSPIKMTNTNRVPIPIPVDIPRKSKRLSQTSRQEEEAGMPVISSVQSLATTNGTVNPVNMNTRTTRSKSTVTSNGQPVADNVVENSNMSMQIKQQIVVKPYPIPEQRNVGTLVRTRCFTKGTQCTKQTSNKEVQTEKRVKDKILIPVPVPIYVPSPMHMYTTSVPIPIPIPIPIPVPIFIPTTRNSANGIMKEIKKIQVKIPSDPYEAELLMMAEMVADDKKEENTDSESDLDDNAGGDDGHFSPEPVDASNTFGDDMLQMALKMATELDEPAVDLEGALTANTITAPQGEATNEEHVDESQPLHLMDRQAQSMRGRKRGMRQGRHHTASKRGRRVSNQGDMPIMNPVQPPSAPEPVEKPDANMCLKYTFGVNAWKQWVTTKNCELEKSSRRVKLFKTEILQLTADELNYSLCLFVKEVRKPNGAEYAPDTIYYLCLGIQQYLFENGRIDNIFCDPYYEKFTDCLDEVARKFSVLYNDSHYIVTRVEEEHLWESKQLGAHSPHVLLSTLMFFNTKHFNLTTVDEHMQLSFSHIMKHWKRNPNQPGASKVPGSRNVLLRFYPPQSAIQNNARKKKVYEQQENEENPLRCPVKLYEFYLSKCPESVKTRNDVFYLQPERSCVPDSPVWYSTMPLPREALEKMLHRVKMVKEINVALLTS